MRHRWLRLEPLEDRRVLADIVLNSVLLVERDTPANPTTPAIGEQVCVRANYQTTTLPAGASYRLQYVVDGVALSSTSSQGAGLSGTRSWFVFRCGWFASPGSHTVEQVMLDADNTVVETNESNNVLNPNLSFTPVAPTSLPQKFLNPLGGVQFRDWSFTNYSDVDPTAGIEDYQGNDNSYNGHDAHDIGLANFARMDTGIPVYAAAGGTVEAVADGNFDRNTEWAGQPANFVTINHGNDWITKYYHLAVNTITVKVGDVVPAGQLLGLVGSSGISTGAHLHFKVEHNGSTVEPNYAPGAYFLSPFDYQASRPTTIRDMGVTNFVPTDDEHGERPAEHTVFSTTGQTIVAWFKYSHFLAGDVAQYRWYRPDGSLHNTNDVPFASDRGAGWYYHSRSVGGLASFPGLWRVAIAKDGVELISRTFTIGTGAAGLKVTLDGAVVSDNRTTAVDFGSVALGGAAISQTFTLTNHGTQPLTLSGLFLPPGFTLNGTFPATIAPATAADLTIDLTTARAGTKFGAIRFTTNDPETPVFNFNISGTITGADPAGAPILTLPAPALAYNVLGQPQPIDATATVTDANSPHFGGGQLRVEFAAISSPQDVLAIRNVGTGPGQIGASGNAVTFEGTAIGTFVGGTGGAPLLVSFNASATLAAVQQLVRNVTFATTATDPQTLARYIQFSLVDDSATGGNQPVVVVVQNLRPTTLSLVTNKLVIADSSAIGKDDQWRLQLSGGNLVLTDLSGNAIDASSIPGSTGTGSPTITLPLTALAGVDQFIAESRDGIDLLTINVSSGDPLPTGGLATNGDPLTVVVSPPNRAPTLDAIADPQPVLEDSGAQAVPLAGITSGPGDSQVLSVAAISSNPALIPDPVITYSSPNSTALLSFTPAQNVSGTAVITVRVLDNGGTAASGVNTVTHTFTVNVTAVNDPPSFVVGPTQAVADGSGLKTIAGWATAISPGPPEEAAQALTFTIVSNSAPALFLTPPTVDSSGALRFTPAPNIKGTAQISVQLSDDGSGPNTAAPQTFQIDVTKPFPWHNTQPLAAPRIGALDVDRSGTIAPRDAILIINYLNARRPSAVPLDGPIGGPDGIGPSFTAFLDTGGNVTGGPNNIIAPFDAVLVINWLNAHPLPLVLGEGEAAAPVPAAEMPGPLTAARQQQAANRPPDDARAFADLIALLANDAAEHSRIRRRAR